MKECLMIIDVQKGGINSENQEIVPLINDLVKRFSGLIIATQYQNNDPVLENLLAYHKLKAVPETDLAFNTDKVNYICSKNIYSALTDEVKEILKKEKISQVYVAGMSTDCCILKTVLDLVEVKIKPIILTKYCAASQKIYHEQGLELLKRLIGKEQFKEDI